MPVIYQQIIDDKETLNKVLQGRCRFLRNSAKCTFELTHFDRPAEFFCRQCNKFICGQCVSLEGIKTESLYLQDDETTHPNSHRDYLVRAETLITDTNLKIARMLSKLDSHKSEEPIFETLKILECIKNLNAQYHKNALQELATGEKELI